jgi:hypothetical protein
MDRCISSGVNAKEGGEQMANPVGFKSESKIPYVLYRVPGVICESIPRAEVNEIGRGCVEEEYKSAIAHPLAH